MKRFTIKCLFICGILFCRITTLSQEDFQLIGSVKGLDTGTVKINSWLPDSIRHSSFTGYISKGKFVVKGKIAHPVMAYLVLNNSLSSDDFFIQAGSQNIYFDATNRDSFYHTLKITGSSINAEYINYVKQLAPFYDSLESCYLILDSLNNLPIEERQTYVYIEPCKQFDMLLKQRDSVKKTFLSKNRSSFVSLWSLYNGISNSDNLEFVVENFKYLNKNLQNSLAGQVLAKRIERQKVFLNGQVFPTMLLTDSAENKTTIRQVIKGKYTLVDFWFSHCGPCIVQFPVMKYLYAKYKNAGFDVIGISVDKTENKKDWMDAIVKHGLNWKQYWDIDKKEAKRFSIDSYPTSFLLNSNGKIIKKNILLEELDVWLEKNLK
jgi:thiol-disulfide isomerase/thioredoxin